jgi:hypothetical protein
VEASEQGTQEEYEDTLVISREDSATNQWTRASVIENRVNGGWNRPICLQRAPWKQKIVKILFTSDRVEERIIRTRRKVKLF